MEGEWQLYRFDWVQYQQVASMLGGAQEPNDFEPLIQSAEAEAIVTALLEREMTPAEAREELLRVHCCQEEPLLIQRGVLQSVHQLSRRRGGEELAEILTEALSQEAAPLAWLPANSLFISLLSPEEARQLYQALLACKERGGYRFGRRRRRGGLVGGVRRFFRHLLGRGPEAEETLRLLEQLLDDATRNDEGIAVLRA